MSNIDNQTAGSEELKPITLDAIALDQTEILSKLEEHQGKDCLRVYVEGKGCDGFTYGVSFDNKSEQDISFPHEKDSFKISVICDPDSYHFVKGSNITFVNDTRGVGYVVENPRHKRFRGKFYKKKVWQERLLEKREQMEKTSSQQD